MRQFWIGIDGTDSPYGGCTTWTLSNLIDRLYESDPDLIFMDYPHLVRLNPNIPEKTRGNGALALHIKTSLNLEELAKIAKNQIATDQSNYRLNPDKSPGLVIMSKKPPSWIYYFALTLYLGIENIKELVKDVYYWPILNQSHIGAIAAIAADLSDDFTYELLSYRYLKNCGSVREIEQGNVKKLSFKYSSTFSSFDYENNRELIAPSGPDPVFCGIRGEIPQDLIAYFEELKIEEDLVSFTIFKTNQATNAHANIASKSKQLHSELGTRSDFSQYSVFADKVRLQSDPIEITGGHVFAKVRRGVALLKLSWFEPTKQLRDVARKLKAGDMVYIIGAIVPSEENYVSVNVEYMQVIDIYPTTILHPPICNCGDRMTSAGKFAGYKCKNCGLTSKFPEKEQITRKLFVGQLVYASSSAQRHLTRPKVREYKRNRGESQVVEYSKLRYHL